MPFAGAPVATPGRALATSSAAIGWMSAEGKRTLSLRGITAMALTNSKNCVARIIV